VLRKYAKLEFIAASHRVSDGIESLLLDDLTKMYGPVIVVAT
jgi:hypothetical protein